MTAALPTTVVQRSAVAARAYVTTSGSLTLAVGSLPVGTAVVVVVFAGRMGVGNLVGVPNANISGAFRAGIGMTQVHADVANQQALGFSVSYGFVQAAAADNAGLSLSVPYTCGSGEHIVVDAIAIAYDGADPSYATVASAHLEDNAFSTPSVTPLADSVLLHIYCGQNVGLINIASDLAPAGFGTFEEDDNIPVLVYGASVIEGWPAARPSVPRQITTTEFGQYTIYPFIGDHLRSAVLAIPIRKGDSAGVLVS